MEIGTDAVRRESLAQRPLRDMAREAAASVSSVEEDPALSRLPQAIADGSVIAQKGDVAGVQMRMDVTEGIPDSRYEYKVQGPRYKVQSATFAR